MILHSLLTVDAWRAAINRYAPISTTASNRLCFKVEGSYIARDCCFYSLANETEFGGAIAISNGNSNISIEISSFVKCSSVSGGGIFSACWDIQISRCQAEDCWIFMPTGQGSFLFQISRSFSSKDISVHECPSKQRAMGIGSIYLQESFYTAEMSNLNSTGNCNYDGAGCALSIEQYSSFALHFSLISGCYSNDGKSLVYILSTPISNFEKVSFINNTIMRGSKVIAPPVIYSNNSQSTDFYQCVFAGNSKSFTFKVEEGNITVRECYFDLKENFGGSIIVSEIKFTYKEAFPLSTISLDLCPKTMPTEVTENTKIGAGTIAGIAIGSSAVVISIVGYISYRLYSKNSVAAKRLRNFEMAESLYNEFG